MNCLVQKCRFVHTSSHTFGEQGAGNGPFMDSLYWSSSALRLYCILKPDSRQWVSFASHTIVFRWLKLMQISKKNGVYPTAKFLRQIWTVLLKNTVYDVIHRSSAYHDFIILYFIVRAIHYFTFVAQRKTWMKPRCKKQRFVPPWSMKSCSVFFYGQYLGRKWAQFGFFGTFWIS